MRLGRVAVLELRMWMKEEEETRAGGFISQVVQTVVAGKVKEAAALNLLAMQTGEAANGW